MQNGKIFATTDVIALRVKREYPPQDAILGPQVVKIKTKKKKKRERERRKEERQLDTCNEKWSSF